MGQKLSQWPSIWVLEKVTFSGVVKKETSRFWLIKRSRMNGRSWGDFFHKCIPIETTRIQCKFCLLFFSWLICHPPKIIADGLGLIWLWKIGVSAPSMERLDVNWWWWWDGHFSPSLKVKKQVKIAGWEMISHLLLGIKGLFFRRFTCRIVRFSG